MAATGSGPAQGGAGPAAPGRARPLAPPAAAAGTLTAAPADDGTDESRPVRIDVSRFEPRTIAPGSTITISGTQTNAGDRTLSDLGLRLQRRQVMTTREELIAADSDADPDTSAVPAFQ